MWPSKCLAAHKWAASWGACGPAASLNWEFLIKVRGNHAGASGQATASQHFITE